MTNLTEKWKKGELEKCKDYYVKYGDYEMSLTLDGDNDFIFYGRPIKPKVLAPVPTFDELKNMNKAVNECMAANIKLVEQNKHLKELLKECKALLSCLQINDYDGNGLLILNKINQVLGE